MAEGKKNVVMHADWIDIFESLEDDEAGRLAKHLWRYINDKNPDPPDRITEISFIPIKRTLKANLKKWESVREKRRQAGTKGGKQTQANQANASNNKQMLDSPKQMQANQAVTVTDTVTDTVSSKEEVIKKEIFLCSISDEKELSLYEKIAWSFWRMFRSNVIDVGIATTVIDKAKLDDWTRHVRLAFEQDDRTQEQFKFIGEFLKRSEFWKKNIRSTQKLREQFERLYIEAMEKVKESDPLWDLKQKIYDKYNSKK